MKRNAIVIGNSDGIGLGLTVELLERGWSVIGLSRSASPVEHPACRHVVIDVRDPRYVSLLGETIGGDCPVDLCVYCAGIGEQLDLADMRREADIFEVNLVGMVRTASVVVPRMVQRGSGHLVGLSSMADELLSSEAPSYHASKAGFSNYLEGLALAYRHTLEQMERPWFVRLLEAPDHRTE